MEQSKPQAIEQDVLLRSGIEKIRGFQEKYAIWGHGVQNIQIADRILEEGLSTSWKTLQDIAYELPSEEDALSAKLTHWDYQGRRVVILIAAPKNLFATDVGGSESRKRSIKEAREHVFEEDPSSVDVLKIPSKRIIGYFDAQTRRFIENPLFVTREKGDKN